MSGYFERLRLIKLGQLPKEAVKKPKKFLKKKSDKRMAEEKDQKAAPDKKQDDWFEYHMRTAIPKCMNCGMKADWLLEEKYSLMWRSSQAHILPKKKSMFPSLANNLDNHLVLFPSFGGHLCGCHGWFDSSWYNASTMEVWGRAVTIFKEKLYPLIPEKEQKNIPEILLLTLVDK